MVVVSTGNILTLIMLLRFLLYELLRFLVSIIYDAGFFYFTIDAFPHLFWGVCVIDWLQITFALYLI